MKPLVTILFVAIFGIMNSSCKKECKECFFIEETNSGNNEKSLGEFCEDEIEAKENETYAASCGTCYNVCK